MTKFVMTQWRTVRVRSLNFMPCSFSSYMKRLWRMSWQDTSIWSWERENYRYLISCVHMKVTMSGERLGNVVVSLSLLKAASLRHPSKATLLRHLLVPMASPRTQVMPALGK